MKKILLATLALLMTTALFAQDFQGVATYKSKRKLDIKLDSTQMDAEMQARIMERLKKQFEKTYILTFNQEASIYKEEEQLEAPQPANVRVVAMTVGGSDVLYKNTKEKQYVNQNESFSKLFLIKDKLEILNWTLAKETKNIGEYTCYKATIKREVPVVRSRIRINAEENTDTDANTEPEMQEITITAWYTTEIPVSNGPGNYHGLPGLILEVNDGTETIICSKIVLNPKDKLSIKIPVKGQELSQAEYDEIMAKKMQEMQNRYERPDNAEGQNVRIRIGG